MRRTVRVFDDMESMSLAAAVGVAELAAASTGAGRLFSMALSGGGTPRRLFEILAGESAGIDWEKVHLFWGDERFVPTDDPSSNFGSARTALLEKIEIPDENTHGISVDYPTAVEAADIYENEMRKFFEIQEREFPEFDLILLGLGEDGHTASIFPGDPVIGEREKWTAAITAQSGIEPAERITLTLPVLNAAKNIFFLVSGESKADVLHDILFAGRPASDEYPAALVSPDGQLVWLVDREAYGTAPGL